ncbi:SLA4-like protein [Mya arenaria]|uniref:SLA4-like protein n=1 Tax=Mya arenaria TaxID=6604 RepID=A0ABY7DTQ6_MYAAR|nr:SLA4-like protein [Mya arenaria]
MICLNLEFMLSAWIHAFRKKRPGTDTEFMILHQNNVPPHHAHETPITIDIIGLERIIHRSYSPDRAPIDFAVFTRLKSELKGKRFGDINDIQTRCDATIRFYNDRPVCELLVPKENSAQMWSATPDFAIYGLSFQSKRTCQEGWISFRASCYYVSNDPERWSDSRRLCAEKNKGFLVSISDTEEDDFISEIFKSLAPGHCYWTGAQSLPNSLNFRWDSGEPWDYTPLQFDAFRKKAKRGLCVYVIKDSEEVHWRQENCRWNTNPIQCGNIYFV